MVSSPAYPVGVMRRVLIIMHEAVVPILTSIFYHSWPGLEFQANFPDFLKYLNIYGEIKGFYPKKSMNPSTILDALITKDRVPKKKKETLLAAITLGTLNDSDILREKWERDADFQSFRVELIYYLMISGYEVVGEPPHVKLKYVGVKEIERAIKNKKIQGRERKKYPNANLKNSGVIIIQKSKTAQVVKIEKEKASTAFHFINKALRTARIGKPTLLPSTLEKINLSLHASKRSPSTRIRGDSPPLKERRKAVKQFLKNHELEDLFSFHGSLPDSLSFTVKKFLPSNIHTK